MSQHEQFVRAFFEEARSRLTRLAGGFVDDPEATVEKAATIFDGMIPGMAYAEDG